MDSFVGCAVLNSPQASAHGPLCHEPSQDPGALAGLESPASAHCHRAAACSREGGSRGKAMYPDALGGPTHGPGSTSRTVTSETTHHASGYSLKQPELTSFAGREKGTHGQEAD